MHESPDASVELVSEDAGARVAQLKQQPGKAIWLCGGGALAFALFDQIDELILKVSPVLLGAGKPLFAGDIAQTQLELAEHKSYANGFVLLRYRVQQRGSTQ